ncbi:hypothetical protein B0A52_03808 [Exophiala mesophila]|uniref:Uncharacterized protein n=1 Tax=Exophiala mesophila TaxID=212818 RepID=A0A438N794_EXOME|nr:hypothetical protein B0A52_03808 [Exophiala mesophila]
MAPLNEILRRNFDAGAPARAFKAQWSSMGDVFSVLLILGGDVIERALAQLVGSGITPVAFSFGWVAYAVSAVNSAVGENRLMPLPDCDCKVINRKTGYDRGNTSWIIGRIMRDFESWKDDDTPENDRIGDKVNAVIESVWKYQKKEADKEHEGSGAFVPRPAQAGLCISVWEALPTKKGHPGRDFVYYIGFITTIVQLGIAAIPCGLYGDWGIIMVTGAGIILSFLSGSLPQWKEEKWACRENAKKDVIITRGNGAQHALLILGSQGGLDLEDLAAGQTNLDFSKSWATRLVVIGLATMWVLLLVTASSLADNAWFLLAVGGIGILQNIYVAAWRRNPRQFGIPLKYKESIMERKVMDALYTAEQKYPRTGLNLLPTFFPGKLRDGEQKIWDSYEEIANGGSGNGSASGGATATSTGVDTAPAASAAAAAPAPAPTATATAAGATSSPSTQPSS